MAVTNFAQPKGGQISANSGVEMTRSLLTSDYIKPLLRQDPVIRKEYWCNVIQKVGFGAWLSNNMGYETSCHHEYNIIHRYPADQIVNLSNGSTITVPVYPTTVAIQLPAGEHYISGKYVLPNVGDGLLLPPEGKIGIITAVNRTTANATTITVRQQAGGTVAITIPINASVIVLSAQEVAECACPTGQLNFEPDFTEQTITMKRLFKSTGDICDTAIEECFNNRLSFVYTNADGCLVEEETWFGGALQTMYQNFELATDMYDLFDNSWGIIPSLKAQSIRWNWADPAALAESDLADLKSALTDSGAMVFEYALWLGSDAFISAQKLQHELGKGITSIGCYDPMECKWLGLNYCGIDYYGLKLHFYEEPSFSHPQMMGAPGFDWGNKGIGLPLGNKPSNCKRVGKGDNKMFNKIFFKGAETGTVYDMLGDSNGFLPGSNKNTYGTGCRKQSYSVESQYAMEIVCPQHWILINFPG